MRKWVIFTVLLAVLGVTACDDEESTVSPQKVEDPKAYGTLCVNSGGEFKDGSCICHGIACDASVSVVTNNALHGSFASITNAPNSPNLISRNYAAILAVRQQATSVHAPEATVKPA